MNLENLNLVELNAQEVQEVDGGWTVENYITFIKFGINVAKDELSFFAGVGDGIRAGME